MNYAIEIRKLTKEYKLYKNDKERLFDIFSGKRCTRYKALNELDINLPAGEVIGVLGKNGSGKSTLLKMIAGVVYPTAGELVVNGSVSALLELTAGFDNELTGRENIYLKGYGLGLTKSYITERLADIIEFAEIGDYIDQPVRMYSSGMKSRLGFAISVNIEPDILVVDEALAVGEEIFRQKCLNKMNDIKQQGKTILFVSHSIHQIKSFCTKGLWLHQGELVYYGDIEETAKMYEQYLKGESVKKIIDNLEKYKNMIEIKQRINQLKFYEGQSHLECQITTSHEASISLNRVELQSPEGNVILPIVSQLQVAVDKLVYKIIIDNHNLNAGVYKTRIYFKVANAPYNRELWTPIKTGHYLDSSNHFEVVVEKNRPTIIKN